MRKVAFWMWTICSIFNVVILILEYTVSGNTVTLKAHDDEPQPASRRLSLDVQDFDLTVLKILYVLVDIYGACILHSFSKQVT